MIAALILATSLPQVAAPAAVLPVQARRGAPTAEVWQIDQVRIPIDTPQATLAKLEPDHTLDAVTRRLTALGVKFVRLRTSILPDRLVPDLRNTLERLPPGEPFVLPERGFIGINVIVQRRLPSNVVLSRPSSNEA